MRKLLYTLLATVLMLQASCSDDVDNLYTNMRAFFRFNAVLTTQPLNSALNNPGQFCKITFPAGKYVFENASGNRAEYSPTAVAGYGKPECIAGFIVGMPDVPDLSTGQMSPVAYDLVCRNCYEAHSIQRALGFASQTTMKCPRCNRIYDLSNSGRVSSGNGGSALYRYRITYTASQGGVVYIHN